MHGLVTDIGITVIVSAIVVVILSRLKQPIILGYLLTGTLLGPEIGRLVFGDEIARFILIKDAENIEVISELGLVLLLFIIGLELNPQKIGSSGRRIIVPGLLQFPLSVLLGFSFYYFFLDSAGYLKSLYLGIFVSLSSTAIVVKILYDKLEMETLYGRLSIGILIFQDIWAILVIALQPNFHDPEILTAIIAVLKSAALLAAGFIFSRFILKSIFSWIDQSPELVVIVSIGWCGIMSGAGQAIGLSMEMGALIAGISISIFPYSIHVTTRVSVLRDFFLSLFFVSLGMKIPVPEASYLPEVLLLLGILFAVRLIAIIPLSMLSGGSFRNSFLSSLTLGQISEFSLVIATIGASLGHIDDNLFAVVLYSMSVTSILSSYVIKYNMHIFRLMEKFTGISTKTDDDESRSGKSYPIVVLGCHRGALELFSILSDLKPTMRKDILVIDYNMESIKSLQLQEFGTLFGDISNIDTLKHAHIEKSKIILSTIPDMLLKGITNEKLIHICKSIAPDAIVVGSAESGSHAAKLKRAGADRVIMPYSMIGETLADFLLGFHTKE